MPDLARIVKAYDIRGIVPDELDESLAREIGAAFVRVGAPVTPPVASLGITRVPHFEGGRGVGA